MFNGKGNAVCDNCGAVHRMIERHVPYNDPDSVSCRRCGKELYRWEGSVEWRAELIDAPGHSPVLDEALAHREARQDNASLRRVFDVSAGAAPTAANIPTNRPKR